MDLQWILNTNIYAILNRNGLGKEHKIETLFSNLLEIFVALIFGEKCVFNAVAKQLFIQCFGAAASNEEMFGRLILKPKNEGKAMKLVLRKDSTAIAIDLDDRAVESSKRFWSLFFQHFQILFTKLMFHFASQIVPAILKEGKKRMFFSNRDLLKSTCRFFGHFVDLEASPSIEIIQSAVFRYHFDHKHFENCNSDVFFVKENVSYSLSNDEFITCASDPIKIQVLVRNLRTAIQLDSTFPNGKRSLSVSNARQIFIDQANNAKVIHEKIMCYAFFKELTTPVYPIVPFAKLLCFFLLLGKFVKDCTDAPINRTINSLLKSIFALETENEKRSFELLKVQKLYFTAKAGLNEDSLLHFYECLISPEGIDELLGIYEYDHIRESSIVGLHSEVMIKLISSIRRLAPFIGLPPVFFQRIEKNAPKLFKSISFKTICLFTREYFNGISDKTEFEVDVQKPLTENEIQSFTCFMDTYFLKDELDLGIINEAVEKFKNSREIAHVFKKDHFDFYMLYIVGLNFMFHVIKEYDEIRLLLI